MRDSYIMLTLGILGILVGLLPFAYINGAPVTLLGGTIDSVYYDVLEKGRAAYIPMLFISIAMIMTSTYEILRKVEVPLEVKLLMSTSYSFSTLAVSLVLDYLRVVESVTTPIRGGVLTVYFTVKETPIYTLFSYKGFAPVFLVAVGVSIFYFIETVLAVRVFTYRFLRRRSTS